MSCGCRLRPWIKLNRSVRVLASVTAFHHKKRRPFWGAVGFVKDKLSLLLGKFLAGLGLMALALALTLPLAVTVYGHTVDQQIRFAGLAQSRGADWLILQPPPVKGLSEADWLDLYVNTEDQNEYLC